jgi:hypothetical protein
MRLGRKLAAGVVEERERPPAPETQPEDRAGAPRAEQDIAAGEDPRREALTGRAVDG